MLTPLFTALAQIAADAPAEPSPQKRMGFSDLQRGFQQWNSGQTDSTTSTGLLIIVAAVALLALILHLRNRAKQHAAPDSERKLFRELSRVVRVPPLTRLVLRWVARDGNVPAAVLLISAPAFDACTTKWQARPTFTPLRQWGKRRLAALRGKLFD